MKKAIIRMLVGLVMFLSVCCAPNYRFKDQPIVWKVTDDKDILEPEEKPFDVNRYFADIFLFQLLPKVFDLNDLELAHNTNALDEVPDSSWFVNRIGVRNVDSDEVLSGPNQHGPPSLPLTVVRGKVGGGNPGFVAKDKRGINYLIKFDTQNNPEMQTATAVIVNRILWAIGYFVPSDHVFRFSRNQLLVDPKATYIDEFRNKVPMTTDMVDEILSTSPKETDGSYRAMSSEYLPGIPKGGISPQGIRSDDPNDVIFHEHRRELRGLRVFCAWLNHSDMKEDNSLDVYVEESGRKYLRHYLLDFGEAFGAHVAEKGRYEDGWEYFLDWPAMAAGILSVGLWKRPWEDTAETPWLSVGSFRNHPFEPSLWREAYPFWPFREMDAADAFWGAKLVMRFDRSLLEAIVAEGKLSHSAAAVHLVDTLLGRARKIGESWLEAVTPLDGFRIDSKQVCTVDLGVYYGLAHSGVLERLDDRSAVVDSFTVKPDGEVCFPVEQGDTYRVSRLRIRRGPIRKPVMQLHYKGGVTPRILGIMRIEPW